MDSRKVKLALACHLAVATMGGASGSLFAGTAWAGPDSRGGPSLALPDPATEEIAIPNWPEGAPLANSVRAWHYLPPMVQPLLELGQAIDDVILSRATSLLLAGVVASRNQCLY